MKVRVLPLVNWWLHIWKESGALAIGLNLDLNSFLNWGTDRSASCSFVNMIYSVRIQYSSYNLPTLWKETPNLFVLSAASCFGNCCRKIRWKVVDAIMILGKLASWQECIETLSLCLL